MMLKRFNNLNLGYKINLGFAALVIVLLLIMGLILAAERSATDKINLTVDVRMPTTLAAASAQSNLLKMQAAVRGYLAIGDLQNIDDYNQAKEDFQQNLAELKMLSVGWRDQQDIALLDQLIELFAVWLPIPEELFLLHDNPLENQPALRLDTVQVQPLNTAILADAATLIESLQGLDVTELNDGWQTHLRGFRSSFDGMSANLSAYAATGNLIFKFRYSAELVTNSEYYGALVNSFDEIEENGIPPEIRTLLDRIAANRSKTLTLSAQIFEAVEGERSHTDLYLFQSKVEPETEQMITLLESLVSGQQALLQSELDGSKRSLGNLRYQTLLSGGLVLLLGAAMVYIFRRNIAKPIHRLSNTAERIGEGELSARATVETDDEIGQLATSFNKMTGQLNETIQALAQAKESAETANRAKSKFLASMSHELRTPLNAILGYTQILQRKRVQDPEQQDALVAIQKNGEHLLAFISDILDLSKIEASKLELHNAPIVLEDFLSEIIQEYRNWATEQQSVEFVAEISPTLPLTVEADGLRLRQILLNLLENAFKFTPRGQVRFSITLQERTATSAYITFTVADTGIGMSEQELGLIFRPFQQVGAFEQRSQGTGLGLAIAQELASAMHTELQVESLLGQGSSFSFGINFPAKWPPVPMHNGMQGNGAVQIKYPGQSQQAVKAPVEKDLLGKAQFPSVNLSDEEFSELLQMALKGELPKLQERSAQLAKASHGNGPFVDALHALIKGYEDEKIIEFLRLCRRN